MAAESLKGVFALEHEKKKILEISKRYCTRESAPEAERKRQADAADCIVYTSFQHDVLKLPMHPEQNLAKLLQMPLLSRGEYMWAGDGVPNVLPQHWHSYVWNRKDQVLVKQVVNLMVGELVSLSFEEENALCPKGRMNKAEVLGDFFLKATPVLLQGARSKGRGAFQVPAVGFDSRCCCCDIHVSVRLQRGLGCRLTLA